MLAALLLCAAIVPAAAAPGVALATGDLSTAQDRVTAADTATRATVLAHSLADERDDLAASVAAGHPALLPGDRTRTDAQVRDLEADAPADLRTALATLATVRTSALAAKSAGTVMAGYQPLADTLGRVTGPLTAPLGRATGAAATQRGLLVAALTAGGSQRTLVADARSANLQEQAALAEFRATAPADLRNRYDQTVTGADTAAADHDLKKLLDGSELSSSDRELGAGPVKSALTARIGLMRGVEASAATDEQKAAAAHRDHAVTALELRAALAALCLILLVGVLVTLFRGITRPLAALYRWSKADAESGEGAKVIGADEFAAVAARVNALTHEAHALRSRSQDITADRTASDAAYGALAAEHETLLHSRTELLRTQDDLMRSREDIVAQLTAATARNAAHLTFVNLSLRTLGLVERQLAVIESLEEHEEEPARLETLFRLDHLATRMRRNSENLLVLTGTEHSHGAAARPVPLIDVARAAISEIERYERVRIHAMPESQVAGRAADDVSHLIAELLDNAAAFSSPGSQIALSGWITETGEVTLSVEDSGIGVPPERVDELNDLLAGPDPAPPGAVAGMGLYVVARLAHRHGVRVELRPQTSGGTTAVVVLPQLLLRAAEPVGAALPAPREPESAPVEHARAEALSGFEALMEATQPTQPRSPQRSEPTAPRSRRRSPSQPQPDVRPASESLAGPAAPLTVPGAAPEPASVARSQSEPAPARPPLARRVPAAQSRPRPAPAPVGPEPAPASSARHAAAPADVPAARPEPDPEPASAPEAGPVAASAPGAEPGTPPEAAARHAAAPEARLFAQPAPGSTPGAESGALPVPDLTSLVRRHAAASEAGPFAQPAPVPVVAPGAEPEPLPVLDLTSLVRRHAAASEEGPFAQPAPASAPTPGAEPEALPVPGPAFLSRRAAAAETEPVAQPASQTAPAGPAPEPTPAERPGAAPPAGSGPAPAELPVPSAPASALPPLGRRLPQRVPRATGLRRESAEGGQTSTWTGAGVPARGRGQPAPQARRAPAGPSGGPQGRRDRVRGGRR